MNNTKRLISLILTALLLVGCLGAGVAVSAATPASVSVSYASPNNSVEVEAGGTVNVSIVQDPCTALNATYSFTNPGIFAATPTASHNAQGSTANNKFNAYNATPMKIVCTISAQIAATANAGDQCVVNFTNCLYGDQVGGDGGHDDYSMSVTITVKAAPTPPPASSTTSTTTKAPTTTTKAPTPTKAPAKGLDFKALNEQITAAEALKAEDYTAASWANLEAALKIAVDARSAKKQADIDSAANALKIAIEALVPTSAESAAALKEMVEEVKKYEKDSKVITSYKALSEALQNAEAALASENKEEIEAAAAKLKAAFDALKKEIASLTKTETVEVEKPGEPEGPFCNVRIHKIWLILLIISFILNLLFIALIVYYFINRDKINKEEAKKPAEKVEKSSDEDSLIM